MSLSPRASRAPRGLRTRSAFGAAFLSLIFPGLGHAYAGAWTRALGFAALPLLALAAGAGVVLQGDRMRLVAMFANPNVLTGIQIVNVIALLYRAAAAVDAWNVARFLNTADASGDGRAGRARLPINPLSVAGLLAVVLVMAGAHFAIYRYDALAQSVLTCLDVNATDPSCDTAAAASPNPSDSVPASDLPSDLPTPSQDAPTAQATLTGATPAPTLPPWNGNDRLNILLVGTDSRTGWGGAFNTDTMIVVSIDPKTKQVAMLQVPRDTTGIPCPPNGGSGCQGGVYTGKINAWFGANKQRTDLWAGTNPTARGFSALKAILGNLYGLDVNYYVMVNFAGFETAIDTIGGVQVNVQIPVAEDEFPLTDQIKTRVYIPAGPQEMTGQQALVYARSRHGSNDFDRGYRQQRVILSVKNQMDPQTVFANLTGLVSALKDSVRTDLPVSDTETMGKLLELASQVDMKGVRSYVFAAPYYATDMWGPSHGTNSNIILKVDKVRATVKQAFTISPAVLAQRNKLSAEGAQVWVLDGKNGMGLAGNNKAYLEYYGMEASVITKLAPVTPQTTTITVYNGAETGLPETIKYLEKLYKVQTVTATDPTVSADIVIVIGRDGKDLNTPSAG